MENIENKLLLLDETSFGPLWPFVKDESITDVDYNGTDLWLTDIHKVKTKVDTSVVTDRFLEVFINTVSASKFLLKTLRNLYAKVLISNFRIISKIENTEGIEKMDEIIEVSDGIMVARGDMGVEVPFKMLPAIQKQLIDKCYKAGKIVVTATQMLDSMQTNPRPTRAEVSDVANAIYDKTTAIMLSGESAAGKYPLESVTTMKDIATFTESNIDFKKVFAHNQLDLGEDFLSAICNAAVNAAYQVDAKAIICVTANGLTAFKLSAYRPVCPIIAVTVNEKACRQLNLAWNVLPVYAEKKNNIDELFTYAIEKALETEAYKMQ